MSDADSLTPCVFIARHGETEWAKSGRYTGLTDIELTPLGLEQVVNTATQLVGHGKLVDPARLAHVFVSPRKRARQTFQQLLGGENIDPRKVTLTEDIAEWDYGDYEGLKAYEIQQLRKGKGLDKDQEYSIWRDGCEGGESAKQITERLDRLILQIRDIQRPYMKGEKPVDVLLVAHGLILRAFTKRWLGYTVDFPMLMLLQPGAIGVLGYKNSNIDQPAFHIGIALPPPN